MNKMDFCFVLFFAFGGRGEEKGDVGEIFKIDSGHFFRREKENVTTFEREKL